MNLSTIDKDNAVTRSTFQAQHALGCGETEQARSLFKQGGESLEQQIPHLRRHADKHLTRFLAASQYYHGGHYQDAERLCQEVRVKMLPNGSRRIYSTFLKDLRERVRPEYAQEVRKAIAGHLKRKKYQAVLDVLKEHQYVIEQDRMAFLRAICCQRLKEYQPAQLFYLDAIQFGGRSPDLLAAAVNLALILASDVDLDEAWSYVQRLAEALTHPLIDVAASLIRFVQALGSSTEAERRKLFAEQVTTFTSAWGKYQTLPADEIDHSFARSLVTLGLESAAIGYFRLGKVEKAKALCEDAVRFAPDSAALKTLRTALTYPAPQRQEAVAQRSAAIEKMARQSPEAVNGVPEELSLIAP